jgi:RimJ/RimL family protein N-acetyltransferase
VGLPTHFRTARLALRPVVASDEAAIVEGVSDLAVSGWLAVVPHPYTTENFRYFQDEIAVPGETFVIEDAAGVAGVVALEDGILGYWVAPRSQGLGYATEAARCLLFAHFARSGDHVRSGYFEGNLRSAKVLAKLGFVETGRDMKHCRARQAVLPHVNLCLTAEAFKSSA